MSLFWSKTKQLGAQALQSTLFLFERKNAKFLVSYPPWKILIIMFSNAETSSHILAPNKQLTSI